MTKWIGLGLAAVAALATGIYLATRSAGSSSADLCVKDLPAPFNTQATDVIAKGDAALMNSFAAQCDAKGWHCAAKELRAKAGGAKDAASHATTDISEVAKSAPEPLRSQAANALLLFMKPKFAGAAEGPDYSRIEFSKLPSDGDIKSLEDLAVALLSGGYSRAHDQMAAAAEAAKKARTSAGDRASTCADAIEKLPHSMPFHFGSSDTFNPPSPQQWARDAVAGKDPTVMKFVADYLDSLGVKVDERIAAGEVFTPAGSAYHETADCIRGLLGIKPLLFPVEPT